MSYYGASGSFGANFNVFGMAPSRPPARQPTNNGRAPAPVRRNNPGGSTKKEIEIKMKLKKEITNLNKMEREAQKLEDKIVKREDRAKKMEQQLKQIKQKKEQPVKRTQKTEVVATKRTIIMEETKTVRKTNTTAKPRARANYYY